jgi:cyclopropane fatty-acyl-phospholipid synthase-like methyltransferase
VHVSLYDGLDARESRDADHNPADGQPTLETLADQGFEVVGIDLSDGLLDQSRENLKHLPNVKLELADIRSWEPPPNKRTANVDCITTFFVFNHLHMDEYKEMVSKMCKWLKPGGILVLGTVANMHGWVKMRMAMLPSTSLTIEANTALLEKNGCKVVKAWEELFKPIFPGLTEEDHRMHQFVCARKL